MRLLLIAAAVTALAVALAACGGGGGNGEATANTSGGAEGTGGGPVSVMTIGGAGRVLADSSGQALYSSDLERNGGVLCTGTCNSFWKPVIVERSAQAASASVPGKLGTIKRPDGTRQLTFNGAPLYSFTQEGPEEVTGDGFVDQFNGHQFTWSVAKVGGGSSESTASAAESQSSGSGGGGESRAYGRGAGTTSSGSYGY